MHPSRPAGNLVFLFPHYIRFDGVGGKMGGCEGRWGINQTELVDVSPLLTTTFTHSSSTNA